MEKGGIKDAQITASSDYSVQHAAKFGRLNFKASTKKQGGWSAGYTAANQWIQVDLRKYTVVKGIATQGRNDYSQWVTKYKLQYSDDGVNFHYYGQSDQSPPKVRLSLNISLFCLEQRTVLKRQGFFLSSNWYKYWARIKLHYEEKEFLIKRDEKETKTRRQGIFLSRKVGNLDRRTIVHKDSGL